MDMASAADHLSSIISAERLGFILVHPARVGLPEL
jgi:hypothetical protein